MNHEDRITKLANSFPSLIGAPGLQPWSPSAFKRWSESVASGGERRAASFVLSVWNHYENEFDMNDALAGWDDDHRRAFAAWVQNPWWA